MKYSINSIVFVVLFLFSCQNGYDNKSLSVDSERYGGIFSYNESGTVKSIFPTSAYYQSEIQLISYIAEPLVKMNEDMSLSPCIAESWDVSPNGLEYLFNIREGIYFHDDPCFESSDGRELDAYDVAFSFTKACQDFENNALSHYLRGIIKGANDYFEGRADEVIGIEVISKHEIKFVLENPYSEFIPVISNPALSIYPKEYFETYSGRLTTHLVGTGPFKISNYEDEKILILERNPGYWQTDDEGKSLPYLSGIKITLEKDKKKELTAFNNSMLSFKNELPRSISQNTLEEKGYQIAKNPIMGTKFLGLFMPNEKLKNKQLRKAIQYSIDREYIVDSLLRGVGKPAHEGIIPPIFAKYQSEPEIGYSFNEKSAKHSIELSGFELTDLKGLDIITTNREEDIMLAESLRDMIRKNIGLELSVKYFHPDEYYPLIEKGKASLFIDGYFGDYPSPENFLHTLFYGKFVPESLDEYPGYNIYRYKNPFYDNLLDSARYSQTNFERMVYFQKAERLLMLDAVIVPLYYFELEYALDEKVRGFKMNPLKTFDLRHAYFSS